MKRQPEIRTDENGTTWALLGTFGGKAYYGNVDKLQAKLELPPVTIDTPPAHYPHSIAYHPITPTSPKIVITGI